MDPTMSACPTPQVESVQEKRKLPSDEGVNVTTKESPGPSTPPEIPRGATPEKKWGFESEGALLKTVIW